MTKIKILVTALFIMSIAALGGCGGNVVATVNGEKITSQQLDQRMAMVKQYFTQQGLTLEGKEGEEMLNMLKAETLEQMVKQALITQEAKKLGLKVEAKDIDNELKTFKDSFTSEADYKKFLAANGISEPKLRDLVELDLITVKVQNKITEDVKPVSEEEAKKYYDENKQMFSTPEQFQVRHILIATMGKEGDEAKVAAEAKTQALSILQQLKGNADFAALAKEKSEDPGSAAEGGLYTFSRGQVVPEFEAATLKLKPGDMTMEPVKTDYGYHIIKLEKVIPASVKNFDEVKAQLVTSLTDEAKTNKFSEYMDDIREKAKVEKTTPDADAKDTTETNKESKEESKN